MFHRSKLVGSLTVLWVFLAFFFAARARAAEPVKTTATDSVAATVIVFIGDSLTQGYGVKADEAYPALVERDLKERGHAVKVINGGISGSVTAEADQRIRWYLRAKPDIIVLALGANDGLKGTPPAVIEKNLKKAIEIGHANGIKVVIAGLKMLSNLGPEYVSQFEAVFPRLAKGSAAHKVELIPFLLEGVALEKSLNLSDMRHPNAEGHKIMAKQVADRLEPLLVKKNR
ncbi:MAG: arylesterase [Bdellovibrionales bacterium]|nr:arylesterase [Bdellovibrionales bacterium]